MVSDGGKIIAPSLSVRTQLSSPPETNIAPIAPNSEQQQAVTKQTRASMVTLSKDQYQRYMRSLQRLRNILNKEDEPPKGLTIYFCLAVYENAFGGTWPAYAAHTRYVIQLACQLLQYSAENFWYRTIRRKSPQELTNVIEDKLCLRHLTKEEREEIEQLVEKDFAEYERRKRNESHE